jgi:hypothetical protein
LKLLTTTQIDLEELFKLDHGVTFKSFTKGYTKIKTLNLSSIDKSYIHDCQLIIDAILSRQQRLRNYNQYINLNSRTLDQLIKSEKRKKSAMFLLEHGLGIIEVNHKYKFKGGIVDRFSKSYIVAEPYRGDCIYIDTNTSIKGGLHELNTKNYRKGGIASILLSNNRKHTTASHNDPPFIDYQRKQVDWLTVCKTTNRVWTNINQMPKEDRHEFAKANGLIDIDFRSSHLQHLVKVLRDDLQSGLYTPLFSTGGILYLNTEAVELKNAILDGDIYHHLADQYNRETGTLYSRDQVKNNIMYWMTSSFLNRKFIQWIRYKYPHLTHYIDYNNTNFSSGTKTMFGKRLPKRNGMAIKLMKSESHLINELVVGEFSSQYPDAKCYTIFDGLLVDQQHAGALIEVIDNKGKEYLKFNPAIKHDEVEKQPNVVAPRRQRIEELVNAGADITSMPTTVNNVEDYFQRLNKLQLEKELEKQNSCAHNVMYPAPLFFLV